MSELELRAFSEMAIAHYGHEPQIKKSMEEIGELDRALLRYISAGCPPGGTRGHDAVIDEIADVAVMVAQLRVIFGPAEVDERIAFKVRRQLDRMERGE